MNLANVRYQDSCIYIGLNSSQDKRENKAFQQEIRNAYIVYKIKAHPILDSTIENLKNKGITVKTHGMHWLG